MKTIRVRQIDGEDWLNAKDLNAYILALEKSIYGTLPLKATRIALEKALNESKQTDT